jgi:hypothetical protein
MSNDDLHKSHTLGASPQDIPVSGIKTHQIPCPVCGKTFKTNSEMERHMEAMHHETKSHEM